MYIDIKRDIYIRCISDILTQKAHLGNVRRVSITGKKVKSSYNIILFLPTSLPIGLGLVACSLHHTAVPVERQSLDGCDIDD